MTYLTEYVTIDSFMLLDEDGDWVADVEVGEVFLRTSPKGNKFYNKKYGEITFDRSCIKDFFVKRKTFV